MRANYWAVPLAVLSFGCITGRVREVQVGALGPYASDRSSRLEVVSGGQVAKEAAASLARVVEGVGGLTAAEPGDPAAFRLELKVVSAQRPYLNPWMGAGLLVRNVEDGLGLTGFGGSGRLAMDATLYAPDHAQVGYVRWEGAGYPDALGTLAGTEAGSALAVQMRQAWGQYAARRAGDERIFLAPTGLTLAPGELAFSSDELLLFRLGAGVGKRVELDAWFGGMPIGGAELGPASILPHLISANGGFGVGALGVVSLGGKVRLVDEDELVPAVSVSYSMLDVFGGAIGAGGGIQVGQSIVGSFGAGAGAANLQFNLFSAAASKHVGRTHLVVGTYLLDNHHFLPQSAGYVAAGASPSGLQGQSGGKEIATLPWVIQPFAGAEHELGPHSALAAEVFPRIPFTDSFATTGVRWLIGTERPIGPIALNHLKLRGDLAGVWTYLAPAGTRHDGVIFPMPFLGLGAYWL